LQCWAGKPVTCSGLHDIIMHWQTQQQDSCMTAPCCNHGWLTSAVCHCYALAATAWQYGGLTTAVFHCRTLTATVVEQLHGSRMLLPRKTNNSCVPLSCTDSYSSRAARMTAARFYHGGLKIAVWHCHAQAATNRAALWQPHAFTTEG
jgi:hypothetical protein